MQEGNLKQLYRTSTLERSVPITDIDAIEKLYQKKVTDIFIDTAPNDIESLNHRARAIALAEKILVSQNKPGITISKIQFFSESAPTTYFSTNTVKKPNELFVQFPLATLSKSTSPNEDDLDVSDDKKLAR